jgi:hypothetical protein
VAGLKLTIPKYVNQGNDLVFWVLEPQSNAVYELQFTTNLNTNIVWTALTRGLPGQTNFVVSTPATTNGFFRLRVPYFAGPLALVVPEDTSVVVPNMQVSGFSGTNGTVSLRVTNGFLKVTVTNGLTLSGNLTSNLTASGTQEALNASLASLRYQGKTNYFGPDGLVGVLTNAGPTGAIWEALNVSITVTPVNDAPVVTATSYTVAEDAVLVVPAPGLLANATDVEGDPLFASLVTSSSSGTVNVHSDGSFVYQASANYFGPDSFTYLAYDGFGAGINVVVTISVTAVNDPPTVAFTSPANGASIAVGVGINLAVSATDIDGTVASVSYEQSENRNPTSERSPKPEVRTDGAEAAKRLGGAQLTASGTGPRPPSGARVSSPAAGGLDDAGWHLVTPSRARAAAAGDSRAPLASSARRSPIRQAIPKP